MTERKFGSYTLWMKWRDYGWIPAIKCFNLPWPSENPRAVLANHMDQYSKNYWVRGKTWMILPEGRKPAGAL